MIKYSNMNVLLITLLLFSEPVFSAVSHAGENQSDITNTLEKKIFSLINMERKKRNIEILEWSDELASLARAHSKDMAARGFFSHRNPDGKNPGERAREAGISFVEFAENILKIEGTTDNPEKIARAAVRGWMASNRHRSNILNGHFEHTGIGCIKKGTEIFLTQNFLVPPYEPEAPENSPPSSTSRVSNQKCSEKSRTGESEKISSEIISANTIKDIENAIRSIHRTKPADRESWQKALRSQLSKSHSVIARKRIQARRKNQTLDFEADLLVDNSIPVLISRDSEEMESFIQKYGELVRGSTNYRALFIISLSPPTYALIEPE